MQLTVSIFLCFTLIVTSTWAQSTIIQPSPPATSQGLISSSFSITRPPGRFVDLLLHPLRPFLGEAGHRALHNAIEVIPMSVLNQVSTLGQLFGALITWNPTAIPQLMNQFFPGASSMFASLLPSLGTAGLSTLTSMATSGLGSSSSPLTSLFRQNFPASTGENIGASGLSSNRGLNAFNPANIASNLFGQGLSNFAGITSSLANGQPLSALLTMAGGAADSVGRFGNLASNGLNLASQAASTASSRFGSDSYGTSASVEGSGSDQTRGGSMFSSPLTNLFANNPFTSLVNG